MGVMAYQINSLTSVYSTNSLFIQAQIKDNIKALRHWPLRGEFTGDRWIPRTIGQQRGKCFHRWRHHECCITEKNNVPLSYSLIVEHSTWWPGGYWANVGTNYIAVWATLMNTWASVWRQDRCNHHEYMGVYLAPGHVQPSWWHWRLFGTRTGATIMMTWASIWRQDMCNRHDHDDDTGVYLAPEQVQPSWWHGRLFGTRTRATIMMTWVSIWHQNRCNHHDDMGVYLAPGHVQPSWWHWRLFGTRTGATIMMTWASIWHQDTCDHHDDMGVYLAPGHVRPSW